VRKREILILALLSVFVAAIPLSIINFTVFVGFAIAAPLIVFFVLGYQMLKGMNQNLLVTMPFSEDTPLKTILLLLGTEDGKVYRYILGHGCKKAGGNEHELRIKYSGRTIYDQKTNTFTIKGWKHMPDTLKVQETG
jgi:hypothetical protein